MSKLTHDATGTRIEIDHDELVIDVPDGAELVETTDDDDDDSSGGRFRVKTV